MAKRIAYLDMVKLVTIYLVILGHVLIMMNPDLSVGGRLYTFIYTFHMPLFVLLSGYFAGASLTKPFSTFLQTKARQLLLPAISCTIIACIYICLFRHQSDYRVEVIGNSWFLKILFIYFMLFYLLKKTGINDWALFAVSAVFLFLVPMGSSLQLNLLYPYFWGGYFIRKYGILEKISTKRLYLFFFVILFVGLYICQQKQGVPNYIPINVNTICYNWYLIAFRYLIGFSGCMMVILIISFLYNSFNLSSVFNKISIYGQKTLGVYVLQTILVVNLFPDIYKWNIKSEFLLDMVLAPIISIVFLSICLWLIHMLSKNRTLDLLLFGGQYYKS